jgi:hypothetical protein
MQEWGFLKFVESGKLERLLSNNTNFVILNGGSQKREPAFRMTSWWWFEGKQIAPTPLLMNQSAVHPNRNSL